MRQLIRSAVVATVLLVAIGASAIGIARTIDSMVISSPSYARISVDGTSQPVTIGQIESDFESLPVSYQPPTQENYLFTWNSVEEVNPIYKSVLIYELSKYDSISLKELGVNRIYVVSNISAKRSGLPILGFADPINKTLYLSEQSSIRATSDTVRSTIHHEIAHMIFTPTSTNSNDLQDAWPKSDNYQEQFKQTGNGVFLKPGFVSEYAEVSQAEDIAEVFAFIMTDNYRQQLEAIVEEDDMLSTKVDLVSTLAEEKGMDGLLLLNSDVASF